jgi:hypothetical protein
MLKKISQNVGIVLLITLLSTVFIALKSMHKRTVVRSFYYWKGDLKKNDIDTVSLKNLGVKRLYIKFFEVGYKGENTPLIANGISSKKSIQSPSLLVVPQKTNQPEEKKFSGTYLVSVAKIDWKTLPDTLKEIVPVVTIDNRVFLNVKEEKQLKDLVIEFKKEISLLLKKDSARHTISEIQFDCDWSEESKDAYFSFLTFYQKSIANEKKETIQAQGIVSVRKKEKTNCIVTAIVRLHHIKDKTKLGIPPVSRAMLMTYNLGDPTIYTPKNSIFDVTTVAKNLDGQSGYAIPIDLMFPIFSYGIVYRSQKYTGIINGLNQVQIDSLDFLKTATTKSTGFKSAFYTVTRDTVFQKLLLKAGDELKLETLTDRDLNDCARLATKMVHNDTICVSFFQLDKTTFSHTKKEVIEDIYKKYQ